MSKHDDRAALVIAAIMISSPCDARYARHFPSPPPINPVGIESMSVGTQGICAGFGHHNSNGGEHTIFGLGFDGANVARSPYDFMKQWTSTAACGLPEGWSGDLGVEAGQHPAADALDSFVGVGYRISLGIGTFEMSAGAFNVNFNEKRSKTPHTANAFGLFPFAALELKEQF